MVIIFIHLNYHAENTKPTCLLKKFGLEKKAFALIIMQMIQFYVHPCMFLGVLQYYLIPYMESTHYYYVYFFLQPNGTNIVAGANNLHAQKKRRLNGVSEIQT